MENRQEFNNAGRFLTSDDISRLDSLVFAPAVERCDQEGLCDTDEGTYYKNLVEPAMIIDGIEYHPRFYSEMDKKTGMCTHYVSQDAIENFTFSQLSDDERKQVCLQFQHQYEEDGGELEMITDDEIWLALNDERKYDDLAVCYIATTRYKFADTTARRDYYISQTLRLADETPTVIGYHDLEGSVYNDTPATKPADKPDEYLPEEVAVLDMVHEDMSTVTTADLKDVCNIMTSLGLITWKDQKRFVSGSSL
ncbi:MAG: hypothetical protein JWM07_224 [Candidatus Saccharibacteria bacterium]|nr:hypothetical protein [Candidatus Saccharibacteria bacterium]